MNYTTTLVSYTAPAISSLGPQTINTDGTSSVALIGSNFATSAYALVGTTIVSNIVVTGSTGATFFVPAGVGASVSVKIVVYSPSIVGLPYSAQESTSFFISYYAPLISKIEVASGFAYTSGGATIRILGSYFGPTSTTPIVTVGLLSCPIISNNQTVILCSLPSGSGNAAVVVNAGLQSSSSLSFAYEGPSITNIYYSGGNIPTSGFIGSSPFAITIVGTSFSSSSATVTMGGLQFLISILYFFR